MKTGDDKAVVTNSVYVGINSAIGYTWPTLLYSRIRTSCDKQSFGILHVIALGHLEFCMS